MSTFVEECRQEWRRLGVPDMLADEMAGDLAADLAEAQSEGVSASEILGESDPRRFAATWASERGLLTKDSQKRSHSAVRLVSVACVLIILTAGIALPLVLTSGGRSGRSDTAQVMHRRVFQMPGNNIACEVLDFHPRPGHPHPFLGNGPRLFCEVNSNIGPDRFGEPFVWAIDETGEARVGPSRATSAPVIPVIPETPSRRTTPATLVDGRDWSFGAFTCEFRSTGLTCRNSSRHGFTLSRKSQQTF